jgi:GTPase SAR1 family protein
MKFSINGFSLEFRDSRRVVIVGASGSGKTYFANQLTTKIANHAHIPVLIVDTKQEEKFRRIKTLEPEFVNNPKPLKRKISEISIKNELIRDYRVSEFAAAVVWTITNAVLYVEELVEHVPKNSVNFPQSNPLLYKLLQQGRERHCSVIVATQRVAQLNLSFVDEATDVFIFRVNSREAKFIEDSFRLPQNSIDFNGVKDFSFYWVKAGLDPVLCDPIPKLTKIDENESKIE